MNTLRTTAEEIIHRTKALLITEDKWVQHKSCDQTGERRCLSYALHCAKQQLGFPTGAKVDSYERVLAAVHDACDMDIVRFNDSAGRTLADIHSALDQAAVTVRQDRQAHPQSLEQTSEG